MMRSNLLAVCCASSLLYGCQWWVRGGETPKACPCSNVVFETPFPKQSDPLPVFELKGAQSVTPVWEELVARAYPGVTARPLRELDAAKFLRPEKSASLRGAQSGPAVVAWVDDNAAEAELLPDLRQLKALDGDESEAADNASRALFKRLRLERRLEGLDDVLTPRVRVAPPTLLYSETTKAAGAEPPVVLATLFSAVRTVGSTVVEGPGSVATASIGAGGQVVGFSRRWRDVSAVLEKLPPLKPDVLEARIRAQFALLGDAHAVIDDLRIAYYDAGAKSLQPVYRFRVRISRHGQHPLLDVGYVAFSDAYDPVPSLSVGKPRTTQAAAVDPKRVPPISHPAASLRAKGSLVTQSATPLQYGFYVADTGHNGFLASANALSGILSSASGFAGVFVGTSNRTAVEQQAGGMDLVLIEGHGDPQLVYMRDTDDEEIDFSTAPIEWATEGRAADWILHSCDVLAGAHDDSDAGTALDATDPWLKTLGNARSVLGYRSKMMIGDGATSRFGRRMLLGEGLAWAWLSSVREFYRGDETTGTTPLPVGRPKAMTLCEHEHDSIAVSVTRHVATCARAFWIDDAGVTHPPRPSTEDDG